MKRKITVFLLAVLLLGVLAAPAFADVMWAPYGNSFYESHREELEYVNRGYLANGPEGYITLKEAPGSLVEVANLPNGTHFTVGQIWTDKDGTRWAVGYHMIRTEDRWESYEGWVPMFELALIYDYIAFEEDHSGEFEAYDGSGDHLTEVCLYSYPGGVYSYNLVESRDYMSFAESFQHLYTDENGLRWAFLGYYMGRQFAWVCMDDPLNENLGTDGYRTADQVRSGESQMVPAEVVPAARTWVVWAIPAALIVVLAAGTAVLVRRKNKKA